MRSSAKAWAVIVAAGRARRFDAPEPKQFATLAGKPMVIWAIEPFQAHPSIVGVTVVVPTDYAERPPTWLDRLRRHGVEVVAGGAQRADSVRLGLTTVPPSADLVAVHDGARPLVTEPILTRVLAEAGAERGVIAARPIGDTVKEVDDTGRVARTVTRQALWRAETPQVFPRDLILDVYRRAETDGVSETDCAALFERYGVQVSVVEITDLNLKVTTREDLDLAEAWLRRRESRTQAETG